jgi:copper homeostasis protein (lipoprotein)
MKSHTTTILALAILPFLLLACKGQVKENNKTAEAPPAAMPDNSRTALDWAGVYQGTLPCADCEGIEMAITLNQDLTYVLQTKHLGKDAPASQRRGTFAWDDAGRSITLSGVKDIPSRYLVGEERLFQLDPAGQRITGAQAERHILQKQAEASAASLTGTRWRLTEIRGQAIAAAAGQKEAFIMLQAADNRFHGSGGCNNLAGAFELQEGSRISFTQIASTKMACPDMSVETELLQILEMVDNYSLIGKVLTLNRARMVSLVRFEAE